MSKKTKYVKLFIYGFVGFVLGLTTVTFYSTFSLDNNEYEFDSLIYDVGDGYIEGVSVNTKVSLYFDYFDVNGYSVSVTSNNGDKLSDDDYVFNGSKTLVYDGEEVVATYINIIKGDINSDGIVDDNDFDLFSSYLEEEYALEEYQIKSFDINSDNSISEDDLTLLEKAYNDGYESINLSEDNVTIRLNESGRLILNIDPNYGVDTNVKWVSKNEDVVTVDNVGRIFGKSGGEAVVQAIVGDGTNIIEANVVVDNSIVLESYEGKGYVEGYDTSVHIDIEDYDGISCSSADSKIATCKIDGEYLLITAVNSGYTSITVKKDNYKDAVYNIENVTFGISSYYRAGCNMGFTPMVSFNAGELVFESSDTDVVKGVTTGVLNTGAKAYVFIYGNKAGRATLKIRSVHSPKVLGEIILDHSYMKLEDRYKITTVNEEVSTSIIGENMGIISCESNKEDVATCRVEDGKLIVTPISLGQADITVYNTINYDIGWIGECGSYPFTVFVQKSKDNTLKSLEISNGKLSPEFDSSIISYEANVDSDTVEIKAVANNSNAIVSGDIGEKKLEYGINKFVITVTSESGDSREYYINITRELEKVEKSNDFTLKSLSLSSGNIYFDKSKFLYEVSVGYDVKDIDVIAIPNNDKASVKIEKPDGLVVGVNTIEVIVTAEDGTVGKYKIIVTRENKKKEEIKKEENKQEDVKQEEVVILSNDATIKSLIVKGYELEFKSDISFYELKVSSENKLDIEVVLNDDKASYEIIGNKDLVNSSIIKIKVTAEDGSTREYNIKIIKEDKFNSSSIVNGVSVGVLVGLIILLMIVIVVNIVRDKNDIDKENGKEI